MNDFLTPQTPVGAILRRAALLIGLSFLSACSSKTVTLPSENYNSRISLVVIHHTATNFEDAVNILTQPSANSVSSHYLVPEPDDESYTRDKLKVFELVPESQRAWHAGRSYWAGRRGLNDQSIGIEIVNKVHCVQVEPVFPQELDPLVEPAFLEENNPDAENADGDEQPQDLCFFPDFAESQISVLIELLRDIHKRHPHLDPTNIVGHSDIAPARKVDPGPRFPWQRLYRLGFGAWYDDATVTRYWKKFITTPLPLVNIQRALHAYGYELEETGILDEQTRNVLRAFQMHFRPSAVTRKPTPESTAVLFALIEKYRPEALDDLLLIEEPSADNTDRPTLD